MMNGSRIAGLHNVRENYLGYRGLSTDVWLAGSRRVAFRGMINTHVGFVVRIDCGHATNLPNIECDINWPNATDLVTFAATGAAMTGCTPAELFAAIAARQPVNFGFDIDAISRRIIVFAMFYSGQQSAGLNLEGAVAPRGAHSPSATQ